tara:strand:- start:1230 stop:2480 length:1251 start_codon:yes stop_codon:yes gene_type:complete
MERYHPRVGLWCIVVAFPTWAIFLLNGMLGFFPALIFADGGVGQKFHFWLFLKDRLFGGSTDPVWSESGAMTSQEWLLICLALPATLGALYCLRRRPEFGSITRNDDVSERESLEMGAINIGFSSGGDAHTQSIVESVLGQEKVLDKNIVSAALGEMGVIAAANAAEDELQQDTELEAETILDSRYTTTVQDENTNDMVTTYLEEDTVPVEEEEDTGWSVWEPDMDSEPEPVADLEPEIELMVGRELPEIPQIFREPILDTPDPLDVPTIPEIPTMEAPSANLGERITSIATQAADTTVNVTKDVVSATVTGAKEIVSIAAGITEKMVEKVRHKSTKGVMPVRPTELPPMAEWDSYQGAWTILGRPVHAVALPELEPSAPDWSRDDVEPTTQMIEVSVQQDAGVKARRTPFIPKLP